MPPNALALPATSVETAVLAFKALQTVQAVAVTGSFLLSPVAQVTQADQVVVVAW